MLEFGRDFRKLNAHELSRVNPIIDRIVAYQSGLVSAEQTRAMGYRDLSANIDYVAGQTMYRFKEMRGQQVVLTRYSYDVKDQEWHKLGDDHRVSMRSMSHVSCLLSYSLRSRFCAAFMTDFKRLALDGKMKLEKDAMSLHLTNLKNRAAEWIPATQADKSPDALRGQHTPKYKILDVLYYTQVPMLVISSVANPKKVEVSGPDFLKQFVDYKKALGAAELKQKEELRAAQLKQKREGWGRGRDLKNAWWKCKGCVQAARRRSLCLRSVSQLTQQWVNLQVRPLERQSG